MIWKRCVNKVRLALVSTPQQLKKRRYVKLIIHHSLWTVLYRHDYTSVFESGNEQIKKSWYFQLQMVTKAPFLTWWYNLKDVLNISGNLPKGKIHFCCESIIFLLHLNLTLFAFNKPLANKGQNASGTLSVSVWQNVLAEHIESNAGRHCCWHWKTMPRTVLQIITSCCEWAALGLICREAPQKKPGKN